ncbi:hypothetical protein NDU88_007032 [Pleurodeles waltl]|uniref:Uncharacterized protein n=1 Tax=Pleurodeles waltl TaxID=8319 RepID=A0AAV7UMQ8_PLEWA|nr:hypothetical protein NDU88_007032 [Pleurodeles waltl]
MSHGSVERLMRLDHSLTLSAVQLYGGTPTTEAETQYSTAQQVMEEKGGKDEAQEKEEDDQEGRKEQVDQTKPLALSEAVRSPKLQSPIRSSALGQRERQWERRVAPAILRGRCRCTEGEGSRRALCSPVRPQPEQPERAMRGTRLVPRQQWKVCLEGRASRQLGPSWSQAGDQEDRDPVEILVGAGAITASEAGGSRRCGVRGPWQFL